MFNFLKMHGLGNDFVIIDLRSNIVKIEDSLIKKISDRKTGIGCDQLILIYRSDDGISDCKIRIFNCDGSEAESCGNAIRCVGSELLNEIDKDNLLIETKGGLVDVEVQSDGMISVDMGLAKFNWDQIPLSHPQDTHDLMIKAGNLKNGTAVNIGNPHVIFFCDHLVDTKLLEDCEKVSKMKIFPLGVNISIVNVENKNKINLITYERGCGFTQACGTAACASVVVCYKFNLCERKASVIMRGGKLIIDYLSDGHVLMTGPVSRVCEGTLDERNFR
tara:strand:- start:58 stop:885 length:828 start_codon:yes stop_codon:yes gene_type:complete